MAAKKISLRMAPTLETEPSNYMQTLTTYLSNIMSSVLLGLPTEIKELIYFDALSHAANMILVGVLVLLFCCMKLLILVTVLTVIA